jgi:hypothetical protein
VIARCAWCEADLGERPGGEGETHTICGPCRRRIAPPADDQINNDVKTEESAG